jgi:lipopolysaccharide biosynthesis glycosyltransferase
LEPILRDNTHQSQTPRIVMVTDSGMLRPTLFAVWTLLQRFTGRAELHFWGDALTDEEWSAVSLVCSGHRDITIHPLRLGQEDLVGAKPVGDYISPATMGRLIIPRKLTGRVLYLDGDVRVTADLSTLFQLDMQGQPLAAARDYVVSSFLAKGVASGSRNETRVSELKQSMQGADVSSYFNAGVLLMDVDAIIAEPALCNGMQDIVRASTYRGGDQDHLNNVFAGRVHLLDPAYNSSWSRTSKQRKFISELGPAPFEQTNISDAIIHFHGPRKPWHKARLDLWSRRARAVFSYRRELANFTRHFPNLTF